MENSKLVAMLQSFDPLEIKELEDFVTSPFFNKNEDVVRLMQYLKRAWPEWKLRKMEKAAVFRKLFPGQVYNDQKLAHLMNQLLRLCEQYLAVRSFLANELLFNSQALGELVDKKLDKHYGFLYQRTMERLRDRQEQKGENLLYEFLLAEHGVRQFYNRKVREVDPGIQVVSDKLDEFYFYNKLKYSCAMLNRQTILTTDYQIPFVNKVKNHLLDQRDMHPLTATYLRIYLCMVFPEKETHFRELRRLIAKHADALEIRERREIYLYAINYCAGHIRKGLESYIPVVLQLYQDGIADRSLFEGEYLSHWTFTNVVKLALRLERYQWIEEFIRKYTSSLDPQFRDDASHFNLAELYYQKKDWNRVLENLSRLNFTDIHYHLGARVILVKTYYELDETEPLLSQLAAFGIYLRRNKKISQPLKEPYLNFCNLMYKLVHNNPVKRMSAGPEIHSTQLLAERAWLTRVWEETANPGG